MSEERWFKVGLRALLDLPAPVAGQRWPEGILVAVAEAHEWAARHRGARRPSARELAEQSGWGRSKCAAVLAAATSEQPADSRGQQRTATDSNGQPDEFERILFEAERTAADSGGQQRTAADKGPLLSASEATFQPLRERDREIHVCGAEQPSLPLAAPAPTPTVAPTKKVKAGKACSEEVTRVWELYRQHHPRAGAVPPKSWGVEAAVAELGEQAVLDLVRWAHDSPDQRAQYLREGNYLGETLFRPSKRATYAEQAAQWLSGVGLPKVRLAPDQRLPLKDQARARQEGALADALQRALSGEEPGWEVLDDQS